MKQMIIGTGIGRLALRLRDDFELMRAALRSKESVGTVANDALATHLVTRICKPGGRFIDIGAHIGSIVAEVEACDSSIRVLAIEAIPDKCEKLREKFPSVQVCNCALGENEQDGVPFYINTRRSGYSSLGRPSGLDADATVQISVPMKTLDSLVGDLDVDVIKIDVEGAELSVLQGGEQVLSQSRPVIMFESAPAHGEAELQDKDEIWQLLHGKGYEVFVPNRVAHMGPGLTQEGFLESHHYPRRTTNYFAIPGERREETRELAFKALNLEASVTGK